MAKTQDSPPAAPPDEDEALQEVATVELPTVGRIVLLRVNLGYEDEPKLRPAIVLEDADEDGTALLHPFLTASDFPLPNAAASVAKEGRFSYGDDCAQWRWPQR